MKRILYYDYSELQESTHVAVINYDDELSLCEIIDDVVYFN